MARNVVRACLAVFLCACGSGDNTSGTDAGGGKDATSDSSLAFPSDGGDAQSDAEAGVEVDSGPPCTEGDFHLDVTNDAGTVVLTGACGDASAPYAVIVDPCLDCLSLQIAACGPSENVDMLVPIFPSSYPVGSWSPSNVTRTDADGGVCHFDTKVTVYNWPDAGGTVKGEYAAYHTGACAGDPALVSGRFCLQRR